MAILVAPHIARMPTHFTILRILQLVFAVLILGLSIYGLVMAPLLGTVLCCTCAVCTIIVTTYVMVATHNRPKIYNYWAILSLEIFLFLFWLVSFAFLAFEVSFNIVYAAESSSSYYYNADYYNDILRVFLGLMAFTAAAGAIEFLLYFISLVIFSVMLSRHRRNGGQSKYAGPEAALVAQTAYSPNAQTAYDPHAQKAYDPHAPVGPHTTENTHMLPQAGTYVNTATVPNPYPQQPEYAPPPQYAQQQYPQ